MLQVHQRLLKHGSIALTWNNTPMIKGPCSMLNVNPTHVCTLQSDPSKYTEGYHINVPPGGLPIGAATIQSISPNWNNTGNFVFNFTTTNSKYSTTITWIIQLWREHKFWLSNACHERYKKLIFYGRTNVLVKFLQIWRKNDFISYILLLEDETLQESLHHLKHDTNDD